MEQKLPKRSEVPVELTWRLEDIYADEAAWAKDLEKAVKLGEEFAALNGKTTTDAKAFLQAWDLYEETYLVLYRVAEYAMRVGDQDSADSHGQELRGKAMMAVAKVEEMCAFFAPEILGVSAETIEQFYKEADGNGYAGRTYR